MKIKTKRYYIYYFLRIAAFVIFVLPIKVGLYLAGFAGETAFLIMKKERRQTLENLRGVFPEKTEADIEKIAKEVFSNLCKNGVEWVNSSKLNKENIDLWIKAEGLDKIDRVLSKGKGGLILSSHFGNWELLNIYFLAKGYPGVAIVRRLYFDKYDAFLNRVRKSKGAGIVYRDESPKKILRFLKRNFLIGIVADQDVDSIDGVFVDFFGKPAYTPKAPVAFSLASGAPIIPCLLVREGNRHRLIIEDPIEVEKKSTKEETVRFNTERWSRIIESYVRKYPEQWVWMHRRWKTKPNEFTKKSKQ
jgi:KDO2-lipid IV(A) lauroyltransferase